MAYASQFNTCLVRHSIVDHASSTSDVLIEVMDGYDDVHAITIDRPAAARALIVAAQAYLDAQKVE